VKGSPFLARFGAKAHTSKGWPDVNEHTLKIRCVQKYSHYQTVAGRFHRSQCRTNQTFSIANPVTRSKTEFEAFPELKTDGYQLKQEFFEVCYAGKTDLLLKHDRSLLKANYTGGYSANQPYDELVEQRDFFIKKTTKH
jgi:hypothetical protein